MECAYSIQVTEIVPSLKTPLGFKVFERIKTDVLFLKMFSTAKWNAKYKRQEAHKKGAVCDDNACRHGTNPGHDPHRVTAISDQPTTQKMLPARAHMLRNWPWIRNPAMTG